MHIVTSVILLIFMHFTFSTTLNFQKRPINKRVEHIWNDLKILMERRIENNNQERMRTNHGQSERWEQSLKELKISYRASIQCASYCVAIHTCSNPLEYTQYTLRIYIASVRNHAIIENMLNSKIRSTSKCYIFIITKCRNMKIEDYTFKTLPNILPKFGFE